MIRICNYCNELVNVTLQLEKHNQKYPGHLPNSCFQIACKICHRSSVLQKLIEKLVGHESSKNCGHGPNGMLAKQMEQFAHCEIVREASDYGIRIDGICIDDNASTRSQMQEDKGPKSKGTMSK